MYTCLCRKTTVLACNFLHVQCTRSFTLFWFQIHTGLHYMYMLYCILCIVLYTHIHAHVGCAYICMHECTCTLVYIHVPTLFALLKYLARPTGATWYGRREVLDLFTNMFTRKIFITRMRHNFNYNFWPFFMLI